MFFRAFSKNRCTKMKNGVGQRTVIWHYIGALYGGVYTGLFAGAGLKKDVLIRGPTTVTGPGCWFLVLLQIEGFA